MKRKQFLFRPNPHSEPHQRAWNFLQTVPLGQKNAYVVQAILNLESEKKLESTLRKILEEFGTVSPQKNTTEPISQEVMGFLDRLMEE